MCSVLRYQRTPTHITHDFKLMGWRDKKKVLLNWNRNACELKVHFFQVVGHPQIFVQECLFEPGAGPALRQLVSEVADGVPFPHGNGHGW